MTLNQLAKEYKKTASSIILNEIFKLLTDALHKKAQYVFYEQKFSKGKYDIEIFDKTTKQFQKEKRTETFRLCDTKKVEFVDVEQELNLKVMELLNKYDARKPFENYLFATLKNWRPTFIQNLNFTKGLNTVNESDLADINDKHSSLDEVVSVMPEEEIEIDDLFANLTEEEKKFIELKKKFPHKNQTEIATILGVTQQRVSQILIDLKKKCNYRL
jgi:RNA polymerase sigma factor (sigma-70 family)